MCPLFTMLNFFPSIRFTIKEYGNYSGLHVAYGDERGRENEVGTPHTPAGGLRPLHPCTKVTEY